MIILRNLKQGSDDWLRLRLGIPTTSRFDKIITPSKMQLSRSAEGYMYELISECVYGEKGNISNEWTRRGSDMEGEAVTFYEFVQNTEVERVGFCLTDDKKIGCSPDGLIGEDGGLEIKIPSLAVHLKYLSDGELPVEYRAQVQGALYVTGRKWWDFISYNPSVESLILRVEPDEEFDDKFSDLIFEFLRDYDKARARLEEKLGFKLLPGGGLLDNLKGFK